MKDACQRYLEDPDANPGHLAECEQCRALFDTLGLSVEERAVSVGTLPLAPWEGASYRAWPLVSAGVVLLLGVVTSLFYWLVLLLLVAVGVCFWAGVSPLRVAESSLVTTADTYGYIAGVANAVREASLVWQIGFGFAFVAVNTALVLLLRRAPRGIDA